MRLREAQIPVLLWVSLAVLMHLGGAQEGDELATQHEGATKLRQVAIGLGTPGFGDSEFDIEGPVAEQPPPAPPASAAPDTSAEPPKPDTSAEPPPSASAALLKKQDVPSAKVLTPPKVKPPEPPKVMPLPAPKVEEKKKPEKKDDPPPSVAVKPPPPEPESDKRTAVQQLQKEDEAINDEAKFLAETNHHVAPHAETRATITALTENNPEPTPGTHVGAGPQEPGNGDKDVAAQDADRKGEKRAPDVAPATGATTPPKPTVEPPKSAGKANGDDRKVATGAPTPSEAAGRAGTKGADGKGATAPVAGALPVVGGTSGSWAAPAGSAAATTPSPVASAAPPGTGDGHAKVVPVLPIAGGKKWTTGLGYGARGEDGKGSIAMDEKVAHAAIGGDELDRLHHVDAETRLSQHRGAWHSSSLERWRPAIENYLPGVQPGNQTELGTRQAPFATYLTQIHNRIHPLFSEGFIDSLASLDASLNDMKLFARMEIVLKPDGTIHHLGIVKTSGVTAFDLGALDAVDRAAPFGKAPAVIVSPDGFVYLHWEFRRDDFRCATTFAYPYILREGETPKPLTPKETDPKPAPVEEKKSGMLVPDERHRADHGHAG